jgi:hypothetical protein
MVLKDLFETVGKSKEKSEDDEWRANLSKECRKEWKL